MDTWLLENLACPRDKGRLGLADNELRCSDGHRYPVVDGIPIMLIEEVEPTHGYITATLEKVETAGNGTGQAVTDQPVPADHVDEFVQREISLTSGNLYISLTNKLTRYPIPHTRLWQGNGERLLDIGCNWGRWSIAAARKNFRPVGLDPSLDAVLAARRISRQLGLNDILFVVGDARFLPFVDDAFEVVFTYGVLQHFSKENAALTLSEMSRVAFADGKILAQMPNKLGIRSFYQQWRRGFSEGEGFDVRYWTPSELISKFRDVFGETRFFADCYFGLGIQSSDVDMLPAKYRAVVHSSEMLRKTSEVLPVMAKFADSVYLESINQKKAK